MDNNEKYDFEDMRNQGPKLFQMNYKLSFKMKLFLSLLYIIVIGLIVVFLNPLLNMQFSSGMINIALALLGMIFIWTVDFKLISKLFALVVMIIVVVNIYSSPIINSNKYYNLLGDVQVKDYAKDLPKIDDTKIPVVDKELAQKLGDKVLGDDIGLGSQYTIGEYYFVSTADDLVWVAPLEPQSFFKWLQNRKGAPGYVYVSATNPNDVKLVRNIEGKDLHLKYTNNSYLFSEIKRHAYLNKNMFRAMTDYSFEIDDNGNPYWVISSYAPKIGFKGYDTEGIITVDAQSGQTKYYDDLSKLPKWVERVHPSAIVKSQVNSWGAYKNGWLNTILAQNEMIQATEGFGYVYIENEPYFYTGLTSIKSDESTVGFMLTNTRTKASTFYKINGATEIAAQKSAQGQVQQYDYNASFPILLNVYNTPTYFMTLKDQDGLIKQYAYVSVKNYNIVGVGNSAKSAMTNYYETLKQNGTINNNVDEKSLTSLTGKIERINYIDKTYYLKIVDKPELFTIDSDRSSYLPLSIKGDEVELKYLKSDLDYQNVISFKNKNLEK